MVIVHIQVEESMGSMPCPSSTLLYQGIQMGEEPYRDKSDWENENLEDLILEESEKNLSGRKHTPLLKDFAKDLPN